MDLLSHLRPSRLVLTNQVILIKRPETYIVTFRLQSTCLDPGAAVLRASEGSLRWTS